MPLLKLLLLLSAFSLASCRGNGPDLTVCLLDPERQELQCATADGVVTTLPLPDATNYVCLSPNEFETLLNYMKKKCR